MVEDKDIVMVIVPSALTLSALLLVVVGLSQREFFELLRNLGPDPSSKGDKYRAVVSGFLVGLALSTVMSGLCASALGVGWMLGAGTLYWLTIGVFFLTLAVGALTAMMFLVQIGLRLLR